MQVKENKLKIIKDKEVTFALVVNFAVSVLAFYSLSFHLGIISRSLCQVGRHGECNDVCQPFNDTSGIR